MLARAVRFGFAIAKGMVIGAAIVLCGHPISAAGQAGLAVELHYAPAENLEKIDAALIDSARREIDLAAYVLTDWKIIDALIRAADRGVALRIYLDEGQAGLRPPAQVFRDLAATPGVSIKVSQDGTPLMHLKSYAIDGGVLRTGSANLSASGLKRQDNDLIVVKSREAAQGFKRQFEAIWRQGVDWK